MSHFSRIRLDTTHPEAHAAIDAVDGANAQHEHQWLWRFFPGDRDAARDFVFRRMDPTGLEAHPTWYIVSQRPLRVPHPAWQANTRVYEPAIEDSQTFAFELRANPVITRKERRHDIIMDAKTALAREAGHATWSALPPAEQATITRQGYTFIQQQIAAWLQGTGREPGFGAQHGFAIAQGGSDTPPPLRVDGYRRHRLGGKDAGGRKAWFTSVDLAGTLVVTDAQRFRNALHRGAGHAKAYGCGLLLIRRA